MRRQVLIVFVCLTFVVFLPVASMGGIWRDDFNGTDISSGWEFTSPTGLCTYEVANGYFSIHLEGNNDIWGGMDDAAKLLRDAPAGDYTIETHIVIEPDPNNNTTNTWTAIIIFDNSSDPSADWWYLARGGNDEINTEFVKDAGGNVGGSLKEISELELYLKAERVGQEYTGYYKIAENDDWIEVGAQEHNTLDPLKVGFCVKSWAVRSMVSNFDYFEIVGDEVEPATAVIPDKGLAVTWGQLKSY